MFIVCREDFSVYLDVSVFLSTFIVNWYHMLRTTSCFIPHATNKIASIPHAANFIMFSPTCYELHRIWPHMLRTTKYSLPHVMILIAFCDLGIFLARHSLAICGTIWYWLRMARFIIGYVWHDLLLAICGTMVIGYLCRDSILAIFGWMWIDIFIYRSLNWLIIIQ